MSTYAISDIHGCHKQLMDLLEKISPTSTDSVYILGDLTDRGTENVKVLKWCIDEAPKNIHFLLGNHDIMMRQVLRRDPVGMPMHMDDIWAYNGGYWTAEDLFENTDGDWRRERLLPFIESLRPYEIIQTEAGPFALVHAGFDQTAYSSDARRPDVWTEGPDFEVGHGFETQNEFVMAWVRYGWFDSAEDTPMMTIFGHTPTTYVAKIAKEERLWFDMKQEKLPEPWKTHPVESGHIWKSHGKIDIDCGCAYGGNLAAIRLEDGEEFYVDGIKN